MLQLCKHYHFLARPPSVLVILLDKQIFISLIAPFKREATVNAQKSRCCGTHYGWRGARSRAPRKRTTSRKINNYPHQLNSFYFVGYLRPREIRVPRPQLGSLTSLQTKGMHQGKKKKSKRVAPSASLEEAPIHRIVHRTFEWRHLSSETRHNALMQPHSGTVVARIHPRTRARPSGYSSHSITTRAVHCSPESAHFAPPRPVQPPCSLCCSAQRGTSTRSSRKGPIIDP